MSLLFNSRDWKQSKPKDLRKKVIIIRADSYKIEQGKKDTDKFLKRLPRQGKGQETVQAGGSEDPQRPLAERVGKGNLSFPSICRGWFAWKVLGYACCPLLIINDISLQLQVSWLGR